MAQSGLDLEGYDISTYLHNIKYNIVFSYHVDLECIVTTILEMY